MAIFVLCDPALVMPPPEDAESAVHFWRRLIEWSADHRLRLGPAGHEMVLDLLGAVGWPEREAANYPPGFGQLAYRALATMLHRVSVAEESNYEFTPPSLSPSYRAHPMGERAIGSDAVALHQSGLCGMATDTEHWEEEVNTLRFDPPPPESLELLFEPGSRTAEEADRSVAGYLADRRLTIVGGVPAEQVYVQLEHRFEVGRKSIRWIGAEPGARLNLNALDGLQARSDIVYCVTGRIGHDGSTKAKKCCRKRGLKLREVERGNDIVDDLYQRHGCC